MVNKKELEDVLKEQVGIYAEFETLCKSEIDALYDDKLNVLLGVMKNKAKLIEKLNKLDMRIKTVRMVILTHFYQLKPIRN